MCSISINVTKQWRPPIYRQQCQNEMTREMNNHKSL